MRALGIILAGGNSNRMRELSNKRAVAAMPVAGSYRSIDFALSNMVNSGINHIGLITHYNYQSLMDHIGTGKDWDLARRNGGIQILPPYITAFANNSNVLYNTRLEALISIRDFISGCKEELVVLSDCDNVCNLDLSAMIDRHIESGADVTMLYHSVDNAKENHLNCHILNLNRQKGVLSIEHNHGNAKNRNIFMDTYVMSKELFISLIHKAKEISSLYTLADVINAGCRDGELDVRGISHRGYFASITDFKSYHDANMDLIDYKTATDLFHDNWPIYTRTNNSCPTHYFDTANVSNSVISNGSMIEGTVENSIVGRGCTIKKGAVIKNCVVLADCTIGENVHIENLVVDKHAKITHAKEIISPADEPGYIKRNDTL